MATCGGRSPKASANISDQKRNANDFAIFFERGIIDGYFFRFPMRLFAPAASFASAAALHAFVRTIGWKLLTDVAPFADKYFSVADKTLSVITGLTGLWLANVVAVVVLDKTFSKVLKSSPLAKKLLPLLKYAATVLIWGFGTVFILSLVGVNVSALLTGAGI